MSFDARGVPWLAPCLATLIVEGVNDQDFTAAREAEASTKEKSGAYDEWLWSRCAPGLDFAGERPPTVEVSQATATFLSSLTDMDDAGAGI